MMVHHFPPLSPIAMTFAVVAVIVVIYSVWNQGRINKREMENIAKAEAEASKNG